MISCPKCGFEQPPDNYCARCGVNMSTYKPPANAKSIGRQILSSGGFYMFLLASVIAASVYMIFIRTSINQFEKISVTSRETRQAFTTNSENTTPPSSELSEAPVSTTAPLRTIEATGSAGVQTQDLPPAPPEGFLKKGVETRGVERSTRPDDGLAVRNPSGPKRVKVIAYFLEIPQSAIPTLFAASGGAATGIISNFSSHLSDAERSSEGRLKTLSRIEKTIDAPGAQIRFDEILNESTGIFIRAIPVTLTEAQTNLDIHIEYRGVAQQGGPFVQEFDGSFSLVNAAAAYFADVLPRSQFIRPEDAPVYSRHSIFKLLTSQPYLTNATDFVIFFEVTGLAEE